MGRDKEAITTYSVNVTSLGSGLVLEQQQRLFDSVMTINECVTCEVRGLMTSYPNSLVDNKEQAEFSGQCLVVGLNICDI